MISCRVFIPFIPRISHFIILYVDTVDFVVFSVLYSVYMLSTFSDQFRGLVLLCFGSWELHCFCLCGLYYLVLGMFPLSSFKYYLFWKLVGILVIFLGFPSWYLVEDLKFPSDILWEVVWMFVVVFFCFWVSVVFLIFSWNFGQSFGSSGTRFFLWKLCLITVVADWVGLLCNIGVGVYFHIGSPVSWGCIVYWLHLGRDIRSHPTNECPGYDSKPSEGEAPVMEIWGIWSTSSLPLLPGPL